MKFDLMQVIQIVGALVQAGLATAHQVADALKAHRGPDVTDEQLNAVCDAVIADALAQKAATDAAVAQAKADGAV